MRVRITRIPKARTGYQVQGGLVNDVPAMGGADYNSYIGAPNMRVNKTLSAVPREDANLEAEGGETVMGNIDGSNIPSFYTIRGPRHANGGVPLNLPDDSFIFSDTKSMKISDPTLLKMFGLSSKKGGYTPAEMSKKYDINKYRKILQDPDTDKISRKTAEIMIKNAVMKLGALALAQEGKKGFPQGIPEIAKPYMEANQIAEEDLIPKQEVPEQRMPEDQMSQGEEGVGPGQEMAMNMPNGEPVAMPEEMPEATPEQMMQAPMAMYGMSMGGFNMPFYNDPNEMAYGGVPKYQPGGKPLTGEELKKAAAEKQARRVKEIEQGYEDIGGGKFAKGTIEETAGEKKKFNVTKGSGKKQTKEEQEAYLNGVCQRMKTGDLQNQEVSDLVGKFFSAAFASRMAKCVTKTGAKKQNVDVIQKEEETPEITTTTTPGKKCQCPDPMDETKWVDVKCPEDGSEPECGGEEEIVDEEYVQQPESNPKWWLQDTIGTMGAFGDLMGTKKYMPWEGRVDLEEPRPTFLDPTRELAAQSEQANIAAQASASFAGPQALGSRLSAIQGQGAGQAADTLSKINNQNVNIANQFEANQVGVRNQENMLNQQMANRVFDKNVIANQQFDNAKRAGRAGLRTAYSTALTNRAKTDAMNQMYPNYQVDPSTGGLVNYTPTDKEFTPGEDEQSAREFADSLSGYTPEMQKLLFQQKYGKRYGGQMFEHGGYVYSTYPMILL
jgi:hypothetical protein